MSLMLFVGHICPWVIVFLAAGYYTNFLSLVLKEIAMLELCDPVVTNLFLSCLSSTSFCLILPCMCFTCPVIVHHAGIFFFPGY